MESLQAQMLGDKYITIAVNMKIRHRLSARSMHNLARDLMVSDLDGTKNEQHLIQIAGKWIKEGRYAE